MKIIELEALRSFAAIYVVFHHTFAKFINSEIFISKFFIFGQEAVMMFFLLSGYVIMLNQSKKDYNFITYFKHRFFRIYTVIIPSLFISYILFSLLNNYWTLNINDLILNLMMLQDKGDLKPGTIVNPIFHNEPLWSLSYEWWFYMIFFVHFILLKKIKNERKTFFYTSTSFTLSLIGIITYYIYFNQVSLFMIYYFIWASGAILYMIFSEKDENRFKHILLLLLFYFILIIIYFYLFLFNSNFTNYVSYPFLQFRHLVSALILIILLIITIKYFKNVLNTKIIQSIMKGFSKLAPISFGIYIIHYPIASYIDSYDINGFVKLSVVIIFTFILSYIIEVLFFKHFIYKRFIKNADK